LLRRLTQDHFDLRAQREDRLETVLDAHGVQRGAVEAGHQRALTTVFGEVTVTRLAYRRRIHANLHPADGLLDLPADKHSHGLRRLAAIEASRGSFDTAVDAIERATGQQLGKRQAEQLAQRAAADFDAFYATRQPPVGQTRDVLGLSADGKGIVMLRRPGFGGGLVSTDLGLGGGSILVLGEQFVNGDGMVAGGTKPAGAGAGAGTVAVVAPLLAQVALLAVRAAVHGDVPAAGRRRRHALRRGLGERVVVAGPPGGLFARRGAVALPSDGPEPGAAGGASPPLGHRCRMSSRGGVTGLPPLG
jgi:hypothetical protein